MHPLSFLVARFRASRLRRGAIAAGGVVACRGVAVVASLAAQAPDLGRERADFARWLATADVSPRAAVAQVPIGPGVRVGPPDADVPLDGLPEQRVTQRGGVITLQSSDGTRVLPRGRPSRLGSYTLTVDGPAGRAVVTIFGPRHAGHPPTYYDPAPALAFIGPLAPPDRPGTARVLGVDGIEVEAAEAGSVLVTVGEQRVRLRVRRLPSAGGEESELEIFFRDRTSGRGSYPAGRFVRLVPTPGGTYRLDFNLARNPFCAYSSAYACPAPWRENTIPSAVTAGERYEDSTQGQPGSPADTRESGASGR